MTDRIAAILHELTGGPVEPGENFFEAGLNSSGLLELHARIERELAVAFPHTAMFAHPNVRALVAYLEGGEPAAPRRGAADRRPADRGGTADRLRAIARARRQVRDRARHPGGTP